MVAWMEVVGSVQRAQGLVSMPTNGEGLAQRARGRLWLL